MTATAEGLFVRGERGAKAPLYPCSQYNLNFTGVSGLSPAESSGCDS
jgi:hypothetical protein